jgi:hypothetical protein
MTESSTPNASTPAIAAPATTAAPAVQPPAVHPMAQSGARWFWWIAGLSLVNTVMINSGTDMSFVVGLGITLIADAFFANAKPIAFAIDAVALGFFFLMGYFGMRGHAWAFILGLIVYVLDALIYVWAQDWMSAGFHALAIFFIVKGVMSLRQATHAA